MVAHQRKSPECIRQIVVVVVVSFGSFAVGANCIEWLDSDSVNFGPTLAPF